MFQFYLSFWSKTLNSRYEMNIEISAFILHSFYHSQLISRFEKNFKATKKVYGNVSRYNKILLIVFFVMRTIDIKFHSI